MYIYIYIYLVRHGNILISFFLFYGFHRRESRGPVAAGNHKTTNDRNYHNKNVPCHDGNHKTTNDGNHKTSPATTETIKQPTTETSPKNTKTRNRSIHSKCYDPPAAAESTKNPATEAITRNGNHKT